MEFELIILLVMVAVFVGAFFLLRLPVAIGLMVAAVAGALVGGEGVPLRQLVEGMFAFFDLILIIATAMVYMKVLEHSGVLHTLGRQVTEAFHRRPTVLLMALMLLVMFPGMITGACATAIFTTGALVAPVMLNLGIPRVQTAAIIAMGSLIGMIAPPVCIPAMIIAEGIDMPYVGFFWPLFLLTIPTGLVVAWAMGRRHLRHDLDPAALAAAMQPSVFPAHGWKLYLPLVVLFVLMVAPKVAPRHVYDIGLPLMLTISAGIGLFTGEKVRLREAVQTGMKEAIPVMALMVGVGMFIEVMTLTGARGYFVAASLALPKVWLVVTAAVALPAFGIISAFGGASVLGVPMTLALLGKDQILALSSIALIVGVGEMVPPTAVAALFSAQLLGLESHFPVVRRCVLPTLAVLALAVAMLVWANWVGKLTP
ncbi:MAG: TRAP transporter large permease subunit [Verrucomicrobia bacterium]|nr:TRAP transporter large permease subunit [Verrucomicrobiota bacterium]